MSKEIELTKGFRTLVDDEDFDALSLLKWSVGVTRRTPYALRVGMRPEGGVGRIYMHRQIVAAPVGVLVDHINGNTLDNRRANLRLCSRGENQHNQHRVWGLSKYRGVSWHVVGKKWQAHIMAGSRKRYIGLFDSEIEAAKAYDTAARTLHGEFASLNFPDSKKDRAA